MPKYRILKLKADKMMKRAALQEHKKNKDYEIFYQLDLDKKTIYGAVVEEQLLMENCALFDQFQILLGKEDTDESIREWLLQEFVIVDFTNLYKGKSDIEEDCIEKLITGGFLMKYQGREVHMLPFDKSGNMSRKCRLSFIHEKYLDTMNERLNLGIDFSKISLNLSKYYAYRGLYLSTAKRIEHELLKITPETLIVINDIQDKEYYQRGIRVEEGVVDENNKSKISFESQEVEKEKIKVPFDGQGLISPLYADLMAEILGEKNINSFQIRLPFAKGMLHRVDFHAFFTEFDSKYAGDTYMIEDAFGNQRDLKLANIIMTKSMFKCFDWIESCCDKKPDSMEFYCKALEKYQHCLYVSSTDLPYGHSKVTHLSYQLINTLKLSKEQFESLVNKQLEYIHNPIKYIELCQGQCAKDNEEEEAYYYFPNWQKALLINPSFSRLAYIKNQLKNIQTALMTKLVLGKLVVKGQMRYMTRDLPFMLVNLIQDKDKRDALKGLKIYHYRFFLPQGVEGKNEMGLEYNTYCGFFRSPHLSRNEQSLLAPVVLRESSQEKYRKEYDIFNRYFGHLTGIVMFGNESLEPMALGGADFDGDLTSMIMDSDVVEAIKAGAYEKNGTNSLDLSRRRDCPYIKIPSVPAPKEIVPKLIPYEQIKNTFSNKIGLISNAAITIGQSEYGNKQDAEDENKKQEENNHKIKCSHCTILTGLEIDAAKNGIHPDLNMLDDDKLTKCNYLKFKKEFEDLKKHKDYHFNQLWMKENKETYTLGLKKSEKVITYVEDSGTYINKLPIIFMKNLNPKLNIQNTKGKKYFCFPKSNTNVQKESVFKEQCQIILDSYEYYSKLFDFIQKDMGSEHFSKINLIKLLKKQYDQENVKKIIKEDLKRFYTAFETIIKDYQSLKELEDKIKRQEWHMMGVDEKKKFLCEILCTDSIDDEEWKIVLQSYNQGYKVLWYIIQDLGQSLTMEYREFKEEFNKFKSNSSQMHPYISKQADVLLENYIETKEMGISAKIYSICLETMQEMVRNFNLPTVKKIEILFNLTKSGGQKARFFWECFEWEEMEPYIAKEECDVR